MSVKKAILTGSVTVRVLRSSTQIFRKLRKGAILSGWVDMPRYMPKAVLAMLNHRCEAGYVKNNKRKVDLSKARVTIPATEHVANEQMVSFYRDGCV
jgi:hypothetical protein